MDPHEPNRRHWDEITPVHVKSDLYRVDWFLAGGDKLDASEVEALGDVDGKTLLHLQCHFGMDSLCWARRGARVTGVDFSRPALEEARRLAERVGLAHRVTFVESDVLKLDLDEEFDVVYTSRGVLGWLSDLEQWGRVVARHLKPGGAFFIQESHPTGWLFDEDVSGGYRVKYPYFHGDEPIVDESPDYADAAYVPKNPAHGWMWSLSDVYRALTGAGLRLTDFREHAWTYWRQWPDCARGEDGRWYPPADRPQIPLVFEIKAEKPTDAA